MNNLSKSHNGEVNRYNYIFLAIIFILFLISIVLINQESKTWNNIKDELNLGKYYIHVEPDFEKADEIFSKLEKNSKLNDEYYIKWILAEIKFKRKNFEEAELYYQKTLEMNPVLIEYNQFLSYIGIIKFELGKYKEAQYYLDKAIRLSNNDNPLISDIKFLLKNVEEMNNEENNEE